MFLGRHWGTDLDTEKKDQKPRWSCRNHVEIMSTSCLWGVDTWFWPPLFCPIGLGPQNVFERNLVDFGEWEIDGIWWVFRHRPYCERLLLVPSAMVNVDQLQQAKKPRWLRNRQSKVWWPSPGFLYFAVAPTWIIMIIIPIHEIRLVMSSPWLGSPWTWHCEPPWTRLRCWSKIGCFNHLVMAPWLAPCDSL